MATPQLSEQEILDRLVSISLKRREHEAAAAAQKKAEGIGAPLEAALARMNEMAKVTADFNAVHKTWAMTKPQTIECSLHKLARPINWDKSQVRSWAEDQMVLVYKPCPKCLEARSSLQGSAWLKRLGVPDNMLHACFDNFVCRTEEDSQNFAVAQTFSRARQGFLVMLGKKKGNGKSHLTIALLRQARQGVFIEGPNLFSQLHGSFDRRERVEIRCKETTLLCLDEFGLSHGYDDELAHTHNILNYRHGNKKKTIITGNFANKEEFYKAVGERMQDRLAESGFKICWFTGESRRHEMKQVYFDESTDEVK